MKRITELTEKRKRTEYIKDAYGNRERKTVEFTAKRPVKTITPGPRFGHFIIDFIAFRIFLYLIEFIFGIMISITHASETAQLTIGTVYAILVLLFYPGYYLFFEYIWQRTPGKYLTKTVVIDEYGNKPNGQTLTLRSLLRVVPFEAFSCFGDYSHGWHDSWSKTWVVTKDELAEIKKLQAEQSMPS